MKNKILLVEDDDIVAEAVTYNLMWNGYQVDTVVDGASALKSVQEEPPDLVILDIALPLMNGLEVCRELRRASSTATLPIIMLTARGREIDKEAGLDAGADDYMTKPFERRELLARVRAVLRRAHYPPPQSDGQTERLLIVEPDPAPTEAPLIAGPLKIDLTGRRVMCDGRELELTYLQFELLTYLVRNRGIVLTRAQLLHHVWGHDHDREQRTLDVHIHWLREFIEEDPRSPQFIETVRGIGYRFR